MSQNIELQRENSNLPPNLCWRMGIVINNEKIYFDISRELSEVALVAKIEQEKDNYSQDTVRSTRVRFREMQSFIYDLLAETDDSRSLFDHLGTCFAIEGCLLIEVFFSTSDQVVNCLENIHQLKELFQNSFSSSVNSCPQLAEISVTLVLFSNLASKLHLVSKETASKAFSLLYPVNPTIPILQIEDPALYESISKGYTELLDLFPDFYGASGKPVQFYRNFENKTKNFASTSTSLEPTEISQPQREIHQVNVDSSEDELLNNEKLEIANNVPYRIAPNLGRALGLTETEIDNITSQIHSRKPEVIVYDILEKAVRLNKGTRKHIAAALLQIQYVRLAKKIDPTIGITENALPPLGESGQLLVVNGNLKMCDQETGKETAISFWHELHETIASIVKSCLQPYNIPISASMVSSFKATIILQSLYQAQQLAIDIKNTKFVALVEKELVAIGYKNKLAVSFHIDKQEVTPENCIDLYMQTLVSKYQVSTNTSLSAAATVPNSAPLSSSTEKSKGQENVKVQLLPVVGSTGVFVPKVSKKAAQNVNSVILDNKEFQFDDKNELYFLIRKKHPKAIELINAGYILTEPDDNGHFPIHHAAQYGNNDAVIAILEKGINVDMLTRSSFKQTSLHIAANIGQVVITETLLAAGANIEALTSNCLTPVRLASYSNRVEVVRMLLQKGAMPNACDNDGATSLHVAVFRSNIRVIELLLEYGADPLIKDKRGTTAFQLAIILKKHILLKPFLQKHPKLIRPAKPMGNPPLLECCINGGDINTVQIMLEHGADPNALNPQQEGSPLHAACELDNLELIEILMKNGADPTTCFPTIATPLHHAIWTGKIRAVKKLIELKVNPNLLSQQNVSPLLKALICEKYEIALFLIESGGADVNQKSMPKPGVIAYPIHIAVTKKNKKVLQSIIDHNGDIDAVDEAGNTSLHIAIFHQLNEMVEFLCQKGANINIRNINGTTPLIGSIVKKNESTIFTLLSYEPDINLLDYQQRSALTYAFAKKLKTIAEFLVNLGASFDVLDDNRLSPFHLGCQFGDVSQVSLMLSINSNVLALLNQTSANCPIRLALQNPPVLKFLLEKGENPNTLVINNGVDVPIVYEAIFNGFSESIRVLLEYDADLHIEAIFGTALHVVVGSSLATDEILIMLLKAGAKMLQGPDNVTPLYVAAERNDLSKAKILLEYGAKVEMKKESNWFTCLHVAVCYNHVEMTTLLLKYAEDLEMKTKNDGLTPLFVAIIKENYNIFDILVENGANIDTQDGIYGNTPLIHAIIQKKLSLAKKLLQLGANINATNKISATPLLVAMLYMSELADTLIDAGAHVNAQMDDGISCLHIAVLTSNNDLLVKLIKKGASNDTNPSPIHYAVKHENITALKILLKYEVNTVEDIGKLETNNKEIQQVLKENQELIQEFKTLADIQSRVHSNYSVINDVTEIFEDKLCRPTSTHISYTSLVTIQE